MAETSFNFLILFTLLVFFSNNVVASAKYDGFSNILSPAKLGLKKEKLSHLHFYFHDITGGNNPTAIRVASAPMTNKSQTLFGAVVMTDDPLTAEPDVNSKLVGKAQGLYASASQEELAFLMVMNFVFVEGKYNGSSIALLGRNTVMTVREMSIVGGSGLFRFARGYARAKTHGGDPKTGDTIVEYNVYVFHY